MKIWHKRTLAVRAHDQSGTPRRQTIMPIAKEDRDMLKIQYTANGVQWFDVPALRLYGTEDEAKGVLESMGVSNMRLHVSSSLVWNYRIVDSATKESED